MPQFNALGQAADSSNAEQCWTSQSETGIRETVAACLVEHLEAELLPRLRELLRAELQRSPSYGQPDVQIIDLDQDSMPIATLPPSSTTQTTHGEECGPTDSPNSQCINEAHLPVAKRHPRHSCTSDFSADHVNQERSIAECDSLNRDSSNNFWTSNDEFGKRYVDNERKEKLNRCMLHPHGFWRLLWDICVMLALVVDVWYVLFEGAFLGDSGDELLPAAVIGLKGCFEVFWWMDIFLNFRTGFFDPSSCTVQMGSRSVACHYLRNWFMVDFVSTVHPMVGRILDGDSRGKPVGAMRFIRMFKMMKLLRLLKLQLLREPLQRLEMTARSQVVTALVGFLKLLAMMLSISHCFACILWRTQCIKLNGIEHASLLHKYAASMHVSVSVMTGMGVGEEWPEAAMVSEQCVLIIYYFVALIFVGIIIHEVERIHVRVHDKRSTTNQLISQASHFMNWYCVSYGLQQNVKAHLRRLCEYQTIIDFRTNLKEWLKHSSGVLIELNSSIYGRCIESHPQLRRLPKDIQMFVSNLCDVFFYEPDEIVFRPGRSPTRMLYVRQGNVSLKAWGSEGCSVVGMLAACGVTCERTSLKGRDVAKAKFVGRPSSFQRGSSNFSILSASSEQCDSVIREGTLLFANQLFLPERDNIQHVGMSVNFCELIALDISKFHQEMRRCHPEMLTMLCVAAAIEADSPASLAWALEDASTRPSRGLLYDGETALHKCVLAEATCCLMWLVCEQHADVNIMDTSGKTAIAKALHVGNKHIIDLLVLNGAQVPARTSAFSCPFNLELEEHSSVCTLHDMDFDPKTPEELRLRLERDGLNCNQWGTDGSKSLIDLFGDFKKGYYHFKVAPNCKVFLVSRLVSINVSAEFNDGAVKILHQTEDEKHIVHQGTNAVKLPGKKMCKGFEEELTTIWRRIGVDDEFVAEHFTRGSVNMWKKMAISRTYIGLRCLCNFHVVNYSANMLPFETNPCLGLPLGVAFSTSVSEGEGFTRDHIFTWCEASRQ